MWLTSGSPGFVYTGMGCHRYPTFETHPNSLLVAPLLLYGDFALLELWTQKCRMTGPLWKQNSGWYVDCHPPGHVSTWASPALP